MNQDFIADVWKMVDKELTNPTEKLLSIRKQLKEDRDLNGNKLARMRLESSRETLEAYREYAEEKKSTVEEVVWLLVDGIVSVY